MANGPSAIRPEELYCTEKAAAILGMSKRAFEDRYIRTGLMVFSGSENHKCVYGEWIIAAIISEGKTWKSEDTASKSSTSHAEISLSSAGKTPKGRPRKGDHTRRIDT